MARAAQLRCLRSAQAASEWRPTKTGSRDPRVSQRERESHEKRNLWSQRRARSGETLPTSGGGAPRLGPGHMGGGPFDGRAGPSGARRDLHVSKRAHLPHRSAFEGTVDQNDDRRGDLGRRDSVRSTAPHSSAGIVKRGGSFLGERPPSVSRKLVERNGISDWCVSASSVTRGCRRTQ